MLKYSSSINSENHELQLLEQRDPGEALIQPISKLEEQIEALNELEIEIQKARKFEQLFREFESSTEKMLELYFLNYEFFSKIINRGSVETIDKSSRENNASDFLKSAEERRTALDQEIYVNIEKIMHLLGQLSPSKEITELKIATRKISNTLTSSLL
jgi:hypothetical protein